MRYEERQHWTDRGSCAQRSFDAALWRVCCLLSSAASLPPLSAQDRHRTQITLAYARDMWVELRPRAARPRPYPGLDCQTLKSTGGSSHGSRHAEDANAACFVA